MGREKLTNLSNIVWNTVKLFAAYVIVLSILATINRNEVLAYELYEACIGVKSKTTNPNFWGTGLKTSCAVDARLQILPREEPILKKST